MCVCVCVCAVFLTKCNDCVLMGDCMHACMPLCMCVCVCLSMTFMWCVCVVCVCLCVCACVCRKGVLVLISMYSAVSLTLVRG